jgi:hypothetical protein
VAILHSFFLFLCIFTDNSNTPGMNNGNGNELRYGSTSSLSSNASPPGSRTVNPPLFRADGERVDPVTENWNLVSKTSLQNGHFLY